MFHTEYTLIGVGAPIQIFLNDVAKMLGAHAIIPQNHEVANALGAVIGSVNASASVEIKPNNTSDGTSGYTVYANTGKQIFEEMEDAVAFAIEDSSRTAESEAIRRGARGNLTFTQDIHVNEAEARDGMIYIGTVVTVHASGSIGF